MIVSHRCLIYATMAGRKTVLWAVAALFVSTVLLFAAAMYRAETARNLGHVPTLFAKTNTTELQRFSSSSAGFVRIIVQECCRTDFIPLQVRLFDKFLSERYELYIVDGSHTKEISQGLESISKTHPTTRYLRCSKLNLHGCYTESYRKLVVPYLGFVVFANSDMFLWRQFSVKSYLSSWGACFAGVVETHAKIGEYIHPGLQILDTYCLPEDFATTILWDIEPGGDVGSMTRHFFRDHPEFRMHPMTWSRNLDLSSMFHLRLIPKEMYDMVMHETTAKWGMRSDFYLENFAIFHPRGGSLWEGTDASKKVLTTKMQMLLPFLESRLRDAPLTWSTMAASTTKPIHDLKKHMHEWVPYSIEEAEPEAKTSIIKAGPEAYTGKQETREGLEPQESIANGSQSIKTAYVSGSHYASQTKEEWMKILYQRADKYKEEVLQAENLSRKHGKKSLPPALQKRNLGQPPPNYDPALFQQSHVYFWKYVYKAPIIHLPLEIAQSALANGTGQSHMPRGQNAPRGEKKVENTV